MPAADNTTPHKATDYDSVIRQTIPNYDFYHRETIDLVHTACPDVQHWLDTGCGTGFLVEKAAEWFPRACFILADPSQAMLDQAEARLKHLAGRTEFLAAAGTQDLPVKLPHPVQVVTGLQCHHYLDREGRRKATEKIYDLLEPGGIYITLENIRPMTGQGLAIGLERWKRFQLRQGRSVETVEAHGKRFGKGYFPIGIQEHLDLLDKTGFRTAELFFYLQMQAGFYAIK